MRLRSAKTSGVCALVGWERLELILGQGKSLMRRRYATNPKFYLLCAPDCLFRLAVRACFSELRRDNEYVARHRFTFIHSHTPLMKVPRLFRGEFSRNQHDRAGDVLPTRPSCWACTSGSQLDGLLLSHVCDSRITSLRWCCNGRVPLPHAASPKFLGYCRRLSVLRRPIWAVDRMDFVDVRA
jgi:hypothetical protein